jgi:UDP-N-acetylglucosamine 1-carboxyvinyltransferase
MEKLILQGGTPLRGTIRASGAKNAALPILFASLLAPGEHRFTNVPDLADVSHTLSLLGRIGCPSLYSTAAWTGSRDTAPTHPHLRVDASRIAFCEAPYDVVRKMRASVLTLGPLLARCGEAKVSLPGGCAIGTRPIDLHLRGLEALGCRFELNGGYIHGVAHDLRGADIHLDFPTVGGTENILMAAVLARGTTRIFNAAKEPEIVDLANFLNSLGAHVLGAGTDTLTIEGVSRLTAAQRPYRILPDRIETGTYLCAAAVTGGDITVTDTDPSLLTAVLEVLQNAGCTIETTATTVRCKADNPLRPFDFVTEPYPAFPTDMQAQLTAVACLAGGRSVVQETVFENRFMHVAELRRMGAEIDTQGNTALIYGGKPLTGAAVMASDLRASAALVLAGLSTDSMTEVLRIYHLDRGYEELVDKLRGVGANIARVSDAITNQDTLRRMLPLADQQDAESLGAIA